MKQPRDGKGEREKPVTEVEIEDAFNRGEIVRTHVLRPTWHFIAPDDIRWLLELTAPRVNVRCGPNYRKYELDAPTFRRSNKILGKALEDRKHLTRAELKAALNRSGVTADDGIRLAHILLRAELDGVVCSGPRKGKQFTYALLDERVPPAKTLTRDEALATLARRYFASHGPATLHDYIWWSALTAGDARQSIELAGTDLEKVAVNEKVYWTASDDQYIKRSQELGLSAHLLPAYDEYNVAYKDREAVLDRSSNMTTAKMLGPTLMVDGKIAGTWQAVTNKNRLRFSLGKHRVFPKPEKVAVEEAMDRYASFLGRKLSS
jgi:hypothetical protein